MGVAGAQAVSDRVRVVLGNVTIAAVLAERTLAAVEEGEAEGRGVLHVAEAARVAVRALARVEELEAHRRALLLVHRHGWAWEDVR